MKKTLILILFFITSCGYQPVYLNKNTENLEFSKIILKGRSDLSSPILLLAPPLNITQGIFIIL